jgi:thiamine biosynthesis protein ThiS
MITVTVNGETVALAGPLSVAAFLERRNIPVTAIAVGHNGTVLHRGELASVQLRDGDRLEIVRMVGGG